MHIIALKYWCLWSVLHVPSSIRMGGPKSFPVFCHALLMWVRNITLEGSVQNRLNWTYIFGDTSLIKLFHVIERSMWYKILCCWVAWLGLNFSGYLACGLSTFWADTLVSWVQGEAGSAILLGNQKKDVQLLHFSCLDQECFSQAFLSTTM